MNLLATILSASGGAPVRALSQQFGLKEDQTTAAIRQLLPALAGGLQRNAAAPGGLDSLLGALAGGGHQRYLQQPDALARPETIQDGNGILGHLLGSKDASRALAGRTSQQTGLSEDLLKKMLPVVASLAMGALSKNAAETGIAARASAPGAARPGGDVLKLLTPLLDANGDGSVVDDLLGMASKFFKR